MIVYTREELQLRLSNCHLLPAPRHNNYSPPMNRLHCKLLTCTHLYCTYAFIILSIFFNQVVFAESAIISEHSVLHIFSDVAKAVARLHHRTKPIIHQGQYSGTVEPRPPRPPLYNGQAPRSQICVQNNPSIKAILYNGQNCVPQGWLLQRGSTVT